MKANKIGWAINCALAAILAFTMPLANAEGGKKRFGDDLIDEVYQLCEQYGIDEGFLEIESCAGFSCVVVKIDCSRDED